MAIYTYTKSTYNLIQLLDEVDVAINKKFYASYEGEAVDGYVITEGDRINFVIDAGLLAGEETSLSNTVTSHVANPNYINDVIANVDMSTSNLRVSILSGGTLYSGSTNIETIISNIASTYSSTGSSNSVYVQPGTNIYTGGTINRPTVNVSALTINSLIVSGNTKMHSSVGSGAISATTNINYVLTPSGAFVSILRDGNNIISGLTKSLDIYGTRTFSFHRNSENKITGWTVN